jgi:hypothetical protein
VTPKPRSAAPRSVAEQTLAVQLEQAGIPFEREYLFAKEKMGRKWRCDFVIGQDADHWEMFGPRAAPFVVLVEVDGATWISGRHNRGSSIAKDYEKGAAAAILGYRVIHATTEQVNDGTCLAWIKAALGLEEAA